MIETTTRPYRYSDLGTPELHQRFKGSKDCPGIVEGGGRGDRRVAYVQVQIPLDYYHRRSIAGRPLIEAYQWEAGNQLFRDFMQSGQTKSSTIQLDAARFTNGEFTESQLEARERWRRALDSINGTLAQLLVLNVCCYGFMLKDLPSIYTAYYRTSQGAMSRFREALDDLAKHYGFI